MTPLGSLSLQTSFLYCNSYNSVYLPRLHLMPINPLQTPRTEPIRSRFPDQWTPHRGDSRKPIKMPSSSAFHIIENLRNFERGIQYERLNLPVMDEEILPVKQRKVAVFWDLDNKPPKVPPFDAAMAVRKMAGKFGDLVDLAAYANRHAFTHVPQWVVEERRERKNLDFLENRGLVKPDQPYVCGVCGRKCKTNVALKKHFRELHERERQKKLSRLNSLKGKRREKFKEQYREKDEKFKNAARNILFPKVGYGLGSELRRAGVFVKTVEDKPQAADAALKRQIEHSMTRGIDCVCLISDDSGFSEMLYKARQRHMRTVVLGDSRALKRYADAWLSWDEVARGNAWDEINAVVQKWHAQEAVLDEILDDGDTSIDEDYTNDFEGSDSEMEQIAEEIVKSHGHLAQAGSVSAFSEEEQGVHTEDSKEKLKGWYDDEGEDWDSDEDEDGDGQEPDFGKWHSMGTQR